MIEFKQRLLTANFLKYKVIYQPDDGDKTNGEGKLVLESTLRITDFRVDVACEMFDHLASLLSQPSTYTSEEYIIQSVS